MYKEYYIIKVKIWYLKILSVPYPNPIVQQSYGYVFFLYIS